MAEGVSLSNYASELSISNKRRYLEKISGIQDPYSIAAAELNKDIIPPVTNTDIFNYLVLGKSFCTSERFKAHKSLDVYKYFICGFVNYLGSKKFDKKFAVLAKASEFALCNGFIVYNILFVFVGEAFSACE